MSGKIDSSIFNPVLYAFEDSEGRLKTLAYKGCLYYEVRNKRECSIWFKANEKSKVFMPLPPIGPLHGSMVSLGYIKKFIYTNPPKCVDKQRGLPALSIFIDVNFGGENIILYFIIGLDEGTKPSVESLELITTYFPVFYKNERLRQYFRIQPLIFLPVENFSELKNCILDGELVFNYEVR